MFTVCPKCGLMLVVTTADLRAAQGHVRCGRCRNVFNALESLCETAPQDSSAAHRPTAAAAEPAREPSATAADAPPSEPAEEVEWIEPEHAAEPEPLTEPNLPSEPSLQLTAAQAEPHQTGESPSDEGTVLQAPEPPLDAPPTTDRPHEAVVDPDSLAEEPPYAPLDAPLTADRPHEAAVDSDSLAEEPPYAPLDAPLTADLPHEAPADEDSLAEEPPHEFQLEVPERRTGAWLGGALVLLLVLAGQAVNHYRGMLATMPSVGSKLLAVYGALGIPVVPLWNVHAYQARQLGATVSGSDPHQITVRASIANDGPWPLPLPLLRVTLQDRYGRTIAARDVRPRDYLTGDPSDPAMLAAGERIDATVAFVNPGRQAIGFEIDACLREGSRVVCAHGTR